MILNVMKFYFLNDEKLCFYAITFDVSMIYWIFLYENVCNYMGNNVYKIGYVNYIMVRCNCKKTVKLKFFL